MLYSSYFIWFSSRLNKVWSADKEKQVANTKMRNRDSAKHYFCLNLFYIWACSFHYRWRLRQRQRLRQTLPPLYIYISLSSDFEITLVHITLFWAKELPTIYTLKSKLFSLVKTSLLSRISLKIWNFKNLIQKSGFLLCINEWVSRGSTRPACGEAKRSAQLVLPKMVPQGFKLRVNRWEARIRQQLLHRCLPLYETHHLRHCRP